MSKSKNFPYGTGVAVGSAFPKSEYSQQAIKQRLGIKNPVVHKLMDSGHIQKRHLYLPEADADTDMVPDESPTALIVKFHHGVMEIGLAAADNALEAARTKASEIDYLIAVTSSGFAVPGVSSMLARGLGMNDRLHRLDVVGMGCNAGMSALRTATLAVKAQPQIRCLLVCVEINSAIYVRDETVRTGIVNSLFGDGAAALVLKGWQAYRDDYNAIDTCQPVFTTLDSESFTIAEEWDAMRFDWDEAQGKWSFFLSKEIPFVIGQNMCVLVNRLLERHQLNKNAIAHWVLHTGGGAVIDGARESIGLDEHQVRHSRTVLRDYGNISSGSFLVSLERLYAENIVLQGDLGIFIAMGPGATLEAMLVRWITGST